MALKEAARGKTVITIAHRLESAPSADRIYLLTGGTIAERGTHAELLKLCGAYASLWREYNSAANEKS